MIDVIEPPQRWASSLQIRETLRICKSRLVMERYILLQHVDTRGQMLWRIINMVIPVAIVTPVGSSSSA